MIRGSVSRISLIGKSRDMKVSIAPMGQSEFLLADMTRRIIDELLIIK